MAPKKHPSQVLGGVQGVRLVKNRRNNYPWELQILVTTVRDGLEGSGDDLGDQSFDFSLEVSGYFSAAIGQADAAIVQVADPVTSGEGTVNYGTNGFRYEQVHVLHCRGQDESLGIWVGECPVIINTDQHTGAAFLHYSQGAQTNRSGNGHDDVSAFVHQGFAHLAAVIGAFEVTDFQTSASGDVPTEQFNGGAVNFIVFGDAETETIHEAGGGGEGNTNIGTDLTGLGHTSGQIAIQEGSLINAEAGPAQIGEGQVINVDGGEFLSGVGGGGSRGGISQQETDGDDDVAFVLQGRR